MRIDTKVVAPVTANEPRESKPTTPGQAAPASVVQLSPAGTTASAPPDQKANTAKIAQIRAAIARGAYPIDLDKLASRILDDEVLRGVDP